LSDVGVLQNELQTFVDGQGLQTGDYANAYGLELSRELLALSASIFEPVQATDVYSLRQIVGSNLNLVPFILYVSTVFLFCVVVVIICVLSYRASQRVAYVKLAHIRVTSPLPLVHLLFGPIDPARTWKDEGSSLFSVETEDDRLNVGPMLTAHDEMAFGIARELAPEERRGGLRRRRSFTGVDEDSVPQLAS